jgi:hypothetical protein
MLWHPLGDPPPTALSDARRQLHWAAQVISATADRWLPAQADDGHTNMEWQGELGALVGNPTRAGLRLALRPRGLALLALRGDSVAAELGLSGRTLAEAMAWADGQAAAAEGSATRGVHARDYDMPDHPVRSADAPFSADPAALEELARWSENADALLRELVAGEPGAVPVRTWPHHFDVGTILFLDSSRQIGFGLSPGDHYYEQPYFYLTIHPLPADAKLPPLGGGGFWREQPPFVGAVLLGSTVVEAGNQPGTARAYFRTALAAGHALLAAP